MTATVQAPSHGPLRDYLMKLDSRLAEAANRTWEIASQIHDRQTEKGANVNGRVHVEKVEENIWRFLWETNDRSPERKRNLDSFSSVDLYLLSCAACCHDFDKGLHNAVLPNGFQHGEGSGDFVCRNWQALSIESQHAAEYIDWIIRIHDCKEDFDTKLQEIPESYTVLNKTGNLRRLATLLKAADTLHLDESRVSVVAVPNESLQGPDQRKQVGRASVHGWEPDGQNVVISFSVRTQEDLDAIVGLSRYFRTEEWPPIARNLSAHHFPHRLSFDCKHCTPSLRDQLVKAGILIADGWNIDLERILIEASPVGPGIELPISGEPLKLAAVPAVELAEYLGKAGPLTVIDNAYIQPNLSELGTVAGAVNRIFVGPANCGKTRAAYEWIREKVGPDAHSWVVVRPESGSIPQHASRFEIDFQTHYDGRGRSRANKAILFADDLPEYLPPPGSGPAASEAVHRLLEWFRLYPGFQERCFVGTIRTERMHDKPDWPTRLVELGDLRLLRVEPLDADQRREMWKGMPQGRSFRNQQFQKLDVEIDAQFLDAVASIETDPEAIAYYVRAMTERDKDRLGVEDAAAFSSDVANIWLNLTWPAMSATYGPAACVFLTLSRFIEAGARPHSGFKQSLVPRWEYHSVFGPLLLAENGGKAEDYLSVLDRMLKDGYASGVRDEHVRPQFDFLLQSSEIGEAELQLPSAWWFSRHSRCLPAWCQASVSFHLASADHLYTGTDVTVHWLWGHACAMHELAKEDPERAIQLSEAELATYDRLVESFGDEATPAVKEVVALALLAKSRTLRDLNRLEEAASACDQLLRCFGDEAAPEVRVLIAMGLGNKSLVLARLGLRQEAVAADDDLVRRFCDEKTPAIRRLVVVALRARATRLYKLGKPEEAMGVCDDLVRDFGDDTEREVREDVAKELSNKAVTLVKLGRQAEAVGTFDELDVRFGADETPEVREVVALALLVKVATLGILGQLKEAVAAYDTLDLRFGEDQRSEIRETLAEGLTHKSALLIGLWRESGDAGRLAEAVAAGRRAVEMGAHDYNLACALALSDEVDEAFQLLESSLADGDISWSHVAGDPDWDSLRDDPKFQSLALKYGTQNDEEAGSGSGIPSE
ncbi:MAG: hypothetical protein FJ118_02650 [Deltaproteobacteria bacterium]|nr:hypothetical protein [Deltaproteobacteria bacterium]